jgi:cytochrome c-type biogenesis protein CcmH
VALVGLIGLPLVAGGIYLALGRPDLRDLPLAMRQAAPDNQLVELVARVEAALAQRPEDGQGWDVIAPAYLGLGQAAKAAEAYAKAIRLLGSTANREAGRGEALALLEGGKVSADARAAFERALSLEPDLPRANFYLARAAEQDGNNAAASDIYRKLLKESPPDAPYISMVREALARVALGTEGRGPAVDPVGLEGAAPEQRLATIRGMVERLAARLKDQPKDLGGRLRLIRAWTMLGEQDKARAAAAEAREALADDPAALRRISDLVLALGLEDKPA